MCVCVWGGVQLRFLLMFTNKPETSRPAQTVSSAGGVTSLDELPMTGNGWIELSITDQSQLLKPDDQFVTNQTRCGETSEGAGPSRPGAGGGAQTMRLIDTPQGNLINAINDGAD